MSAATQGVTDRELVHQRIARTRRVLLDQWDPLNVGGNPNLADEYDSYLGRIMKALDERRDAQDIADLLFDIEEGWRDDHQDRREACLAVALSLLEPSRT